jgi:hypothetical protein
MSDRFTKPPGTGAVGLQRTDEAYFWEYACNDPNHPVIISSAAGKSKGSKRSLPSRRKKTEILQAHWTGEKASKFPQRSPSAL